MIEVKVRCSGKLHRIVLKDNGKLVLVDHQHGLLEEKALVALGGETPRCLRVLDAWRNARTKDIPSALRPALADASRTRMDRRFARLSGVDPLRRHLSYRQDRLIEKVARQCLASTWYADGKRCEVRLAKHESMETVLYEYPVAPGETPCLRARIRRSWYRKVFMRGIAVVDGVFVLDVLEETADGYVVQAGKSPAHYATRRAVVSNGELRWLE